LISTTSLLVVSVLVAIVSWLIARHSRFNRFTVPDRRAQEIPKSDEGPRGAAGWLRLYILLSYFVMPILGIAGTSKSLRQAELARPYLADMPEYGAYKLMSYATLAVFIGWHWWVAYRLQRRHEASSLHHVRLMLLGAPFLRSVLEDAVCFLTFGLNPLELGFGEWLAELGKSYKLSGPWLLYFFLSRRVKNTYLGAPGAATHEAAEAGISPPP
jgi:hypothetical protein